MNSQSRRGSAGGFAFVAVLMVMLVVVVLIAGVLAMAVSARNLSTSRHEYTQALYVAEAGINRVVSDWRKRGAGNPPAQPYAGTIANAGSTGSFRVTWAYWQPQPGLVRQDVVVLTSQGTVNTGGKALTGTILDLTRTVQVNLDTNGDWAWNHVYTTDDPNTQYQVPPYADVNGASGYIDPPNYLDEHGPGMSKRLPTPKWDEWEATALAYDHLPYAKTASGTADPARHVYWSGQTTSAHTGAGHTHYNYFMPDPYFPSLSYPSAYGCDKFTVEFRKQAGTDYSGVYFVHGNVIVKNGVTITGILVATGNITFQGQGISIIPLVNNPQNCATRTVYPALIGGYDIEIRDQSTFHTTGIIWAGHSFTAKAADQSGCIVSPHMTLSGNFSVTYGFDTNNPSCPRYEPGSSPPPMFNEPGMDAMQPFPHTWREL
jgi:hypothetical protein